MVVTVVDIQTVTGQPIQLKPWDISSVRDPASENNVKGNRATLQQPPRESAQDHECPQTCSHTPTPGNEVLVYPWEPRTVWQFVSPSSKVSQFHEYHLEYLPKFCMLSSKWKPLKMHSLISKCGVSLWVLPRRLTPLFTVVVMSVVSACLSIKSNCSWEGCSIFLCLI